MIIKWTFGCFRVPFRWNWNSVIVPRSERNPPWKVLRTTGWCLSADRSTATFSILWRKSYFIYTKVSRDQKEVWSDLLLYIIKLSSIVKLEWCVIQADCTLATWCMQIWSTVALQGQKVVVISKRDQSYIKMFISNTFFACFFFLISFAVSNWFLFICYLWQGALISARLLKSFKNNAPE